MDTCSKPLPSPKGALKVRDKEGGGACVLSSVLKKKKNSPGAQTTSQLIWQFLTCTTHTCHTYTCVFLSTREVWDWWGSSLHCSGAKEQRLDMKGGLSDSKAHVPLHCTWPQGLPCHSIRCTVRWTSRMLSHIPFLTDIWIPFSPQSNLSLNSG